MDPSFLPKKTEDYWSFNSAEKYDDMRKTFGNSNEKVKNIFGSHVCWVLHRVEENTMTGEKTVLSKRK